MMEYYKEENIFIVKKFKILLDMLKNTDSSQENNLEMSDEICS